MILFELKNINLEAYYSGRKGSFISLFQQESVLKDQNRKSVHLLKDINLQISSGDRIALIGNNGAGKTSLLRLLSGIYEPSSGTLIKNTQCLSIFSLATGQFTELDLLDNIQIIYSLYNQGTPPSSETVNKILDFANLEKRRFQRSATLSRGEMQKLFLSIVIHCPSQFFIFDESLTNIDKSFRKLCCQWFDSLSDTQQGYLLTSHDQNFLLNYCDKAIWLEDAQIKQTGEINEILASYNSTNA